MAAGILNHHMTAAQAFAGGVATPAAASAGSASNTSSPGGASTDSATISANDFLTLLVTEMQNQDPTADTDPNEYINQLVNVNSLEQLISINQTLSTDLGSTPASQSGGATSDSTAGLAGNAANGASAQLQSVSQGRRPVSAQTASPNSAATIPGAISAATARLAPGNLSIPAANTASERVAQALNGRPRVQ